MDFDDLLKAGLNLDDLKRVHVQLEEIKKLYNIGEAEYTLIQQMSILIKIGMNLSPELQLKLVRAYGAMLEVVHTEMTSVINRKK